MKFYFDLEGNFVSDYPYEFRFDREQATYETVWPDMLSAHAAAVGHDASFVGGPDPDDVWFIKISGTEDTLRWCADYLGATEDELAALEALFTE